MALIWLLWGHHAAADPGAATAKGRLIAVGVTAGMNNQGVAREVIHPQSRSDHWCCGVAIGVDDEPTQIAAMAIAEGPLVRAGVVWIPVATSR